LQIRSSDFPHLLDALTRRGELGVYNAEEVLWVDTSRSGLQLCKGGVSLFRNHECSESYRVVHFSPRCFPDFGKFSLSLIREFCLMCEVVPIRFVVTLDLD